MKKKISLITLLFVMLMIAGCKEKDSTIVEPEKDAPSVESAYQTASKQYLSKVDVDYAKNFAESLGAFKTNEKLGFRTAGSQAEIDAGNKIFEEMKALGLEEVAQDPFTVDAWTFEKADMTFTTTTGETHEAVLGAYQVNFNTDGVKSYEVIYAGKGTKDDLADLNIEGKMLLVDINQRDEWWVNYPALQAHFKGAAGIIAVQEAGYGEVDEEALNAQDFCGPEDAPAFSMSQADANLLKEAIAASPTQSVSVDFDAKSTVQLDSTAYNISGKIIGKDPESYIIYSSHYDAYFDGFQDDSVAVGMMLGIAKGLIDSGYQPEKTIIFTALAAEEWGMNNTRYDWSTGAYNQIFNVHPEWAGKAVANINFEMTAYEHDTAQEIRASYELKNYLEDFIPNIPTVDGVYKDGTTLVTPTRTLSDDFSFSIAGIPALRNDFKEGTFKLTHYHSQYDDKETYSEKAYLYNHNLYGLLGIYYDQTAVVPLDFTVRLDALKEAINEDVFKTANVSSDALVAEIDAAIKEANLINTQVQDFNKDYVKALNNNDSQAAEKIYNDSRALNAKLLSVFKFAQDKLVKLTWEDSPIFPHEHAQTNVENLQLAIEALESGDIAAAVDEYLWAIDNNWYAYDWDRDVFDYYTDYALNQPADRLMWGAGRIVAHEDLFDPINALVAKQDEENADISAELATLKTALENQKALLQQLVDEETATIKELAEQLKK